MGDSSLEWLCFVVEGEGGRRVRIRMNRGWSSVQLAYEEMMHRREICCIGRKKTSMTTKNNGEGIIAYDMQIEEGNTVKAR